jgi:peptidoglycan hydrolase-like protein with peptidoglycan-binding domain
MSEKQWLYLTSPMMRGPAVRRWQELCIAAGHDLDADGAFGPIVDKITREVQAALGLKVDGIVGPATLEKMHAKLDSTVATTINPNLPTKPFLIDGVEVWDYRGEVPPPKNGRWTREWSDISGIVLHRTACVLGEKPERYFPVNAHIGVTLEGRIVLAHPWELMIWHGHYPSKWTIGIEYDGNPEGFPGYHWKPGGGPHEITEAQVKAGDVLLKLLTDAFEKHGVQFKYIYAHRQASDQRECDPGFDCWKKIAIPWMEKTGATPGDVGLQGTVFGTGFHIPQSWDPRSPVSGFRVGSK